MTRDLVGFRCALLPQQTYFSQFQWLSKGEPGLFDPAWNGLFAVTAAFPLPDEFDAATVEAALAEICARQPSFRTRYVRSDDPRYPVLQEALTRAPDFQALERLGADPASLRIRRFFVEEAERGVSAEEPLTRFRLVRLAPDDQRLVVVSNHGVADGVTGRALLQQLMMLCQCLLKGSAGALPPQVTVEDAYRFRASRAPSSWTAGAMDLLLDGSTFRSAKRLGEQRAETTGAERGPVEVVAPRPLVEVMRASSLPMTKWEQYRCAVSKVALGVGGRRELEQSLNAPMSALCIAIWTLVMHRYLRRETLSLAVLDHGRPRELEGIERAFGCFAQLVVLMMTVNLDETLSACAERLGRQMIGELRSFRLTLEEGTGAAWRSAFEEGRSLHMPVFNYQEAQPDPGANAPLFVARGLEQVHGPGVLNLGYAHMNVIAGTHSLSVFFDSLLGDDWNCEVVGAFVAALDAVAKGARTVRHVLAAFS